jgi:outer membrane protein OmpA-like peptidoglycan-associated protein
MAIALFLYSGLCFAADASGTMHKATAQPNPPAVHHEKSGRHRTPKVELFLGYSYLRAVPVLAPGNRMEWLHGGSTSVAFNLNRYLGLVGDFGGFKANELEMTGAGASPAGVSKATGTAFTYMAGPRLSLRKYERLTPFAQVLVGGIRASEVTLSGCTGRFCTPLPLENALAMTAGGGLDLRLKHHLSLRLFQAEYMMTRFADLTTGDRKTQNDMRLSTGLVVRFGGKGASLPVTYGCAVMPASVYPGDPVSVTGTAMNLNPKKTAVYSWTADGGAISGTTATATIDTRNSVAGTYTVHGHVSEGNKPDQVADCTASYTVMAFAPPTVSCSANPSSVHPGDSSMITAQGVSPGNRPLTYSFTASGGSISGATSTATLTTAGLSPGTVTVTCNVVDDKGQTASATTSVVVEAVAPPPAVITQSLCAVHFDRDVRRPTRVDNEAKACLDDIALALQRSADAKVALAGNTAGDGMGKTAAQRAVNTKDYLVNEKGVDASRISVYSGSTGSNTVDATLIPTGAVLDTTGLTPVDESVRPIARSARPAKR